MTKLKCEELLDAFLREQGIKRKSNRLYYTTNPMPPNSEFWQSKARAAERIAQQQKLSKEIADYYGHFEDEFLESYLKNRKAHPPKTFVQDSTVSFRPFKPLLKHEIDFLRYEAISNEAHNKALYRSCVMGDFETKECAIFTKVENDAPTLTPEMIMKCIDEFRKHPPKKKILEVCPGPDEYVKYTSSLFEGTFVSLGGKLFREGELIGNVYEKK